MLYTSWVAARDYKILVLPSGGATGIIPATFLACLEKETGKPTYQLFDEIWSSSIGSMIASLLTVPKADLSNSPLMTAEEVVKFLETAFGSIGDALRIRSRFRHSVSPGLRLGDTLIPVRVVSAEVTQANSLGWPKRTEIRCFSREEHADASLADIVCGSCTVYPIHWNPEKVQLSSRDVSLCIDAGARVCSEPCMNPLFPLFEEFSKNFDFGSQKVSIYFISNGWIRMADPAVYSELPGVEFHNIDVDLKPAFQKWRAGALKGRAFSTIQDPILKYNLAAAGLVPLRYLKELVQSSPRWYEITQ